MPPNPGSIHAIVAGCTCSIYYNGAGRDGPPWMIAEDCPIHKNHKRKPVVCYREQWPTKENPFARHARD